MAQVLFVSPADVIKRTGINGNVDRDQMIQFIKIAQDIHIQNILGTKLFNKIASDISADTLTGNYLTLFTNYIQDMVIHWAAIEILPTSTTRWLTEVSILRAQRTVQQSQSRTWTT